MEEELFIEVKQSLRTVINKLEDSSKNLELSKDSFMELNLMLNTIKELIKSSLFEIHRVNKVETEISNVSDQMKSILEVKEYQIGSYKLNTTTRMLTGFDKSRKLTKKEMQLLAYLSINNKVLVKRTDCLAVVWNEVSYNTERSMDVYMFKIRKYLKDDASIYIINIHGVGYRMIF